MIKSSMPFHFPLILLISHFMSDVSVKTTTWIGGGGTWEVPTACSDGLPSPGDSAIISGWGSNVVMLSGTTVHLAYLKITDEATLSDIGKYIRPSARWKPAGYQTG